MKIEYPISINYLKHWTIYDGIREFIQNAIDADSNFIADCINYDKDRKELRIINNGIITLNTLLLGNSYKDGNSTIGQFGEGYKLGALVLSRENKAVDIYSGNLIFQFFISDSTIFQEPVLNVNIIDDEDKTETNTCVRITNITLEEYNQVIENTLLLQYPQCLNIDNSYILYENKYKGKIFIKDLYICTIKNLMYGYNFDTGIISLNRDRNLVDNWNIFYKCASLWNQACQLDIEYKQDNNIKLVYEMLKTNCGEAEHLANYHISNSVSNVIHKKFIEEEGDKRIASNNNEVQHYSSITNNVYISDSYLSKSIRKAPTYIQSEPKLKHKYRKNAKPIDILIQYASEHTVYEKDWNEIESLAKSWRIKQNNNL